ncbi:AraC family transcriptional regulator [Anaeromyxobacter paludicola]|uniref:AraC family transcriptional regulator n=1 Tax=Anaeromyxobacter paludicola TaxID=2918171 RepID=A0ABM7X6Y8_9BACT|nr:AraC family transcriptional regulator [Anaeromyxobacter paludicola]BDG07594.1 AraC family transcriptional regulator [Anaeromyxobacter paludicola]
MTTIGTYTFDQSWRVVLADLGVSAADVLRRASLPGDLLSRERVTLTQPEYFRLWRGFEEEVSDPTLPLRIGATIKAESFDPPLFAALCSPDLDTALGRIALYKVLTCPMRLDVQARRDTTTLVLSWLDALEAPPALLVATELVFFVALARLGTRSRVQPLAVEAPVRLEPANAYTSWFGVAPRRGRRAALTFAAADSRRPFLTSNEAMWRSFEPELKRRLAELDARASTAERVRASLLELLPGGAASIEAVSARLGASSRTLQRRLHDEQTSFATVLAETRAELARHYLGKTALTAAEISFLLGFEDPNSFYRAFHAWTGATPEQARSRLTSH